MKLGLVGLPASGKTTLFNALRGGEGEGTHAPGHAPGAVNLATVTVPDERMDFLAEALSPKKVTYATIDYVDIPGIIADSGRQENTRILAALREVDALVHVVRMFENDAVPHPRGSIDPLRDIREVETELVFADLAIADARIQKLEASVKKPTPQQKEEKAELDVLLRCRDTLEAEKKISELDLSEEDEKRIRNFCFLTQKPEIIVLNVGEDRAGDVAPPDELKELPGEVLCMCAQVEMEIAALDPEDREVFLKEMNIAEPAGDRLKSVSYRVLKLASFFTTASDDLRAWTIHEGATALEAAAKVHTDIARGFIRAEVVSFDDFKEAGSMKEVRARGKLRLEGKDHIVQDGDIMFFRFNV